MEPPSHTSSAMHSLWSRHRSGRGGSNDEDPQLSTGATPDVPDTDPAQVPIGARWRVLLALLARLPQGALSRAFGRLADVRIPRPLRRGVLGAFARGAGIDSGEAALPLTDYPSLDAFFVRALRPGLRAWPRSEDEAGSPVDGVVGQLGAIREGTLLQAKGRAYRAASLLDDAEAALRYESGCFLTLYLSPRHYHRIHAPTSGRIVEARHVPGALLPVNDAAVRLVAELFPRNERLAAYLDGPLGRVAVVAIGAYNVGRISASFDPAWGGRAQRGSVTNRRGARAETRGYAPGLMVEKGAELMAFHLGSTVVLLFEQGVVLEPSLGAGAEIRLGARIAARGRP